MNAIVFEKAGDPAEVLTLGQVDAPVPGPGQVLVAVEARPVHPADLAFIRGSYRLRPQFPQVAGLSGAGRVLAAAPGAPLVPGTRVAFRWPGAWAEQITVPFERTFVVPDDISTDDAAQLPLNPITAWGLLDMAEVAPGDVIALTAPTSSVSRITQALAEARGVPVVAIGRDGATPREVERLRELSAGAGLAALIDSVGGALVERLLPELRQGATIVTYGTLSPDPIQVHNATIVYSNLTWKGFGIDRWLSGLTPSQREGMVDALWNGIRSRTYDLAVSSRVPLRDFATALSRARSAPAGKVLLT
jgi:NADPH:quinone reductase-like Zn-dependent oxidoreductase